MTGFNLAPLWDFRFTALFGVGAAGMEAAASRDIFRAGWSTFKDDTLARSRDAGVGDGHSGKQGLSVGVQRVVVQFVPLGKLNDNSQIHDRDPVAYVAHHA